MRASAIPHRAESQIVGKAGQGPAWRGRSSDRGLHPGWEGLGIIEPSARVRMMMTTRPIGFSMRMEGFAALLRDAMGGAPFSAKVYAFRLKRANGAKLPI